jgi:CheY-like chemotaxis protein
MTLTLESLFTREIDRPTVLVVDDDPDVRAVTTSILSEIGGFRVIEAGDGEEALGVLVKRPEIACIVTDVKMPRRDGISLASAAKRHRPDLHIVFVTGMNTVPRSVDQTVVLKPFRAANLLNAVARIERRA